MIELFDHEQGSPEWHACRLAIPTASEFHSVMAKGEGKVRRSYMLKLAGEAMTGEIMEGYTNANMERGKAMEAEARALYSLVTDKDLTAVGFVRNGRKGCSPDSLIGKDGGVEIKTALPHIQVERLLKNALPLEHRAQVQGSIWICEREWWDFVSYWPKLPPLIVRVARDDGYIATLAGEIARFNDELADIIAHLKGDAEALLHKRLKESAA